MPLKKPIFRVKFLIMKRLSTSIASALLITLAVTAQNIKTPAEFLGYEPGTQFTYHHRAVEYFRYIAEQSPLAEFVTYGISSEGRTMGVCFVSSEENLKNLEELRKNNRIKTGLEEGSFTGKQIPFVWMGYNIHGNESVGMEAAIKTLYTLVSGDYKGSDEWLKNMVIVIDPCQNPDGRELYTVRYRSSQTLIPDPKNEALEHYQGWPGTRSNHYMFDLNRDWTWQTQTETQQRIAFYNKYMPQVFADFHEMGPDAPFFFAPGAEPWHEVITQWQRDFHKLMGKGNAALFDEKYRLYFTKEAFDLFAPSYGDTWPLFNGAMGFTYEQGGGGTTGLAYKLENDDTLTLGERIEGHFLASMATVKVANENREKLVNEFNKFFADAQTTPIFAYKSVIIKGTTEKSTLESLLELLGRNQIRYTYAAPAAKKITGFDYSQNREAEFSVEKNDILISLYQPQSRLVSVLFETDSKASDSLSYDLSAWALPYAFNLKAYATKEQLKGEGKPDKISIVNKTEGEAPYAWVADFTGFNELKLMAALYKEDIKLRYSLKPFETGGKKFSRGSLIITRGDNRSKGEKLDKTVIAAANEAEVQLLAVKTGLVDNGKDFGSQFSPLKKKPEIGLMCGPGTSSGSSGELWYYFEKELKYPVTLINTDYAERVDFTKFDVLILPSGSYAKIKDTIIDYVKRGGKVLALEQSASVFSSEKTTNLAKAIELRGTELKAAEKKEKSDDPKLLKKFEYEIESRYSLMERSAGSIYRVKLDETNPYVFGMGNEWFVMKRTAGYPFLNGGYNIGYILEKEPVSGFAGVKFREKIKNTLVIGSERIGSGEVVYVTDNPYIRAFWKNGRILLGNIVLR
jgi:hypothetical protein